MGPSFPAIVGSGANGAIVHYRPTPEAHAKVSDLRTPILIDTGGHYLDGTTDTTRTLLFSPDASVYPDLKEMYTRVLMGNLDLQLANFPAKKTMGMVLDSFARQHLWDAGCDFSHGVGHGVSHCGPVHEYPHYAFARGAPYATPLESGMVITNEPGFYKEGQYGIRIENILHVTSSKRFENFLEFENMTLVPYCKELIETELLQDKHKNEIKSYYEDIGEKVAPLLAKENDRLALDYLND